MKRTVCVWCAMVGLAACARVSLAAVLPGTKETDWKSLSAEIMTDEGGRSIMFASSVGEFRKLASVKPTQAIDHFFSPSAKTAWEMKVALEFKPMQITDFFSGAVAMTGSQTAKRGIWGLYNPFWDAILFLDLRVDSGAGVDDRPISVQAFTFMSGEALRGEPMEASEAAVLKSTVLPVAEPLAVEIWRAVSSSRKAFEALLPMEGRCGFENVLNLVERTDRTRDILRMQIRSALRLKEASLLLNDVGMRQEMKRFRRLLVAGTAKELDEVFDDRDSDVLRDTFKEMPYAFRQKFGIYGFLKVPQGTQFLFVNSAMPRLIATVTVMPDGSGEHAALEWYDLAQSDELLAAWNAHGSTSVGGAR